MRASTAPFHPDRATGHTFTIYGASGFAPGYVTPQIGRLYYAILVSFVTLTVLLMLMRAFTKMMDTRRS
jgi:hypothetical protein